MVSSTSQGVTIRVLPDRIRGVTWDDPTFDTQAVSTVRASITKLFATLTSGSAEAIWASSIAAHEHFAGPDGACGMCVEVAVDRALQGKVGWPANIDSPQTLARFLARAAQGHVLTDERILTLAASAVNGSQILFAGLSTDEDQEERSSGACQRIRAELLHLALDDDLLERLLGPKALERFLSARLPHWKMRRPDGRWHQHATFDSAALIVTNAERFCVSYVLPAVMFDHAEASANQQFAVEAGASRFAPLLRFPRISDVEQHMRNFWTDERIALQPAPNRDELAHLLRVLALSRKFRGSKWDAQDLRRTVFDALAEVSGLPYQPSNTMGRGDRWLHQRNTERLLNLLGIDTLPPATAFAAVPRLARLVLGYTPNSSSASDEVPVAWEVPPTLSSFYQWLESCQESEGGIPAVSQVTSERAAWVEEAAGLPYDEAVNHAVDRFGDVLSRSSSSHNEAALYRLLREAFPDVVVDRQFRDQRLLGNGRRSTDFATRVNVGSRTFMVMWEADGRQHFREVEAFRRSLAEQRKADKAKAEAVVEAAKAGESVIMIAVHHQLLQRDMLCVSRLTDVLMEAVTQQTPLVFMRPAESTDMRAFPLKGAFHGDGIVDVWSA